MGAGGVKRCVWAGEGDPAADAMVRYHDSEWGVPVHDDRRLFEFLILEGAQAGLSWSTILNKRDGYRRAFRDFDPVLVAAFTPARVERLLEDRSIVRNRAKVRAAVGNAVAFLRVQEEFGSFDAYLWDFVGFAPLQPARLRIDDLPAETPLSRQLAEDLRARGFRFVGPTIAYAFMQAVGLVNDHTVDCFRWEELGGTA